MLCGGVRTSKHKLLVVGLNAPLEKGKDVTNQNGLQCCEVLREDIDNELKCVCTCGGHPVIALVSTAHALSGRIGTRHMRIREMLLTRMK